jgi:anti-sigma factor RsiW
MECRDVRDLLDSYLAQELLVETNHELLRHLPSCPECSAELDARLRLREGLKRAFARSSALAMRPEFANEVKARLQAVDVDAPTKRKVIALFALAASILIAAVVGIYVARSSSGVTPALAQAAAGDHQNCAVKYALKEKPIPLEEAAAKYDPAFAHMETSPADDVTTPAGVLHVADRHSCVFADRRFGHVVFKMDDHLVSVLMTADAGTGSGLTWLPRSGDFAMASLHVDGHVVFIVSDLADAPFRQVAQQLADPASKLAELLGNISPAARY